MSGGTLGSENGVSGWLYDGRITGAKQKNKTREVTEGTSSTLKWQFWLFSSLTSRSNFYSIHISKQ